jgi:RNA polymerase sigma-70 factor, ECF subfamily
VERDLVARAHAERPAGWVRDDVFLAHVRGLVSPQEFPTVQAADLYVACACRHGVTEAIEVLEREHFARVREFAASIDTRPEFVQEITQRLRTRLLTGDPPRIATYSGRGSLGGWIRVAAIRLARDLVRADRAEQRVREEVEPSVVDPELGWLKRAYGEAVSRAVQAALASVEGQDRALLSMHYVDGLTIDQVGVAFGVSRATSARLLAAARARLVTDIRDRIIAECGVRGAEADSLLAFVRSRLDLSLGVALKS